NVASFIWPFHRATAAAQTAAPQHEFQAADYDLWLGDYLSKAAKKYEPNIVPGRIYVFPPWKEPKGPFINEMMDWSALAAGGIELTFIDGDHYSMFRPPGVSQMAEKIVAALAEAAEPRKKYPNAGN